MLGIPWLLASAQNFEQLFVLRALQGLGFGGEWAVARCCEIVRATEAQSGGHRARLGRGKARRRSYTVAFSLLPPEWGMAQPVLIGVLPAFLVLHPQERPNPKCSSAPGQGAGGRGASPWTIFRPR